MAVASMKFVNIAGHISAFDTVARLVGDSGVFQPEKAASFFSDDSLYVPMGADDPYAPLMEKLAAAFPEAAAAAAPPDRPLRLDEASAQIESFCAELSALEQKIGALDKEIRDRSALREKLSYFEKSSLDLYELSGLTFTDVQFGRLPLDNVKKLQKRAENESAVVFAGSSDALYEYAAVFFPLEGLESVERMLDGLHFECLLTRAEVREAVKFSDCRSVDEIMQLLLDLNRTAELQIEEARCARAALFASRQEEMRALYEALLERSIYSAIREYAVVCGETFVLVGWTPAKAGRALLHALREMDGVEVVADDAAAEREHNPPVLLKNNAVARPFEMYVGMYGMPSYGDFDPTPFVALTYTLLFGIMFADLGQGLLLSLAGWLLWRFKKMGVGRILVPCGLCSAVFGLVFGSVFGFEHALDPLYRRLFGLSEKPLEVMEPATTNLIIYAAVGIGFVLVVCAMLLNIYACIRRRDLVHLFFGPNGLPGLIFYVAAAVGLFCQLFLGIPVLGAPYVICLIVLPLVLIYLEQPLGNLVLGKKEKIEWGNYLAQSFFELFETLLSYVTNTMSFLRVGAFVLVHAGMMTVVFTLAEMTFGAGYVLIVVLGNLLITVLEALLVSIQVLRLEYYEMFSRFYDGGGRPFEPVRIHE